ncbi:LysE/ArgO family amino acid transporter [Oceanimonas baumannii]|uniref:Amino acid transporter n=1 Tax=Oceanimonas baumannii TaxID=129578 RepID=A0A235CPK9_9GAMM|nr:LysE/ArgO family amino acid transporter [Oceanimonas baumannii]OYD26369.1 amino acid transporter [Oceanimonas baumannii]TDW61970.1 L-lysine exporter family protein LysE/ArgO [Oceanimonas baumannii]
MSTFLSGFALSFSLILAIGSQNAFVLKQGIKRHHVFVVCAVCALSDALLISFGVAGFGAIVTQFPVIETLARYGGAAFLAVYAFLSFKSAFSASHAMTAAGDSQQSVLKTVAICLAFTWLNPHVYLDTVVLLGSISTQYHPDQGLFAAGAVCASFVFFFSLGYGARVLAPVFQRPQAWKVLEFVVGLMMTTIAVTLVVGA